MCDISRLNFREEYQPSSCGSGFRCEPRSCATYSCKERQNCTEKMVENTLLILYTGLVRTR